MFDDSVTPKELRFNNESPADTYSKINGIYGDNILNKNIGDLKLNLLLIIFL